MSAEAQRPTTGAFHDAAQDGLDVPEPDFLVVGSGAGGGAAARVLAASGAKVVVLEEGPLLPAGQTSPVLRRSMATLFRARGKMAAFGKATTPILQGCCVGGTTFINSAIIWRLPEKVLHDWHERYGLADGFRQDELDAAAEALEREMHVRPVAEGTTANQQDLLMREGARKAGIEARFVRRSEKDCQGSGRCLFGCPHEAKQSTAVNSLRRAVEDGAQVFAHARVERVAIQRGRAVAVAGRIGGSGPRSGEAFWVGAKKAIVVAASAVQSPNLLRRSGIRRRPVGGRFMAHPGSASMGIYPRPVHMWTGASQGFEAFGLRDTLGVKLESINVPPEVAASRMPGAGERLARYLDRLEYTATWSVAVRAEAVGWVRPSRLYGDKVSYSMTPRDVDKLRMGLKRLAEMHFFAGATEVVSGVHGMPEVLTSPDQLALYDDAPLDPRAYTTVCTHLFGGCCAGRDPAHAVVDPHLKVHGVEALYVMDASVFPSNIGVNPQHSIMSVARVAAARLC